MLLQFNFKNFKSFKDETTLDLTAARVQEYDHVFEFGNEKVLPVTAMFGANASGKSNIFEAFHFMHRYVIFSLLYGNRQRIGKDDVYLRPIPFLFDEESRNSVSSFEVYFISNINDKFYNYGFSLDKKGVAEEWLNSKAKTSRGEYKRIFYRNRNKLDMPGIHEKSRENITVAIDEETLVVSLGDKLKIEQLRTIYDWFLSNQVSDFSNPFSDFLLRQNLPDGFSDNADVQKDVVSFLASFDPSIIGFESEEMGKEDNGRDKFRFYSIHKMINSNKTTRIPLEQESSGTQKMIAMYAKLQYVLESGGVLFVDELNAKLHPLLIRVIVQTFLNPLINKYKAQLIYTTHDSWQLNNNTLRRDEIWFTEKNEDGVSTLYSLSDFVNTDGAKIRKDENFEKNYLLGKYGAIPNMKSFDFATEE